MAEATWPAADFIVGNPPFLGDKKLRGELPGDYVDDLWRTFHGRVPGGGDLVCYFFEKARTEIAAGRASRVGLLATNSIRGGANRRVLDRIKQTGDIFMAWNDESWVLEGAAVRISIVGFDNGDEKERVLDGVPVATINADLTGATDVTMAKQLGANAGLSFIGDQKSGAFDVPGKTARAWIAMPLNPNGRPNSVVVRPWANGLDLTRRPRDMWIVDFGVGMPEHEAALYEAPFEYVRQHVKPIRDKSRTAATTWWLHERPRGDMRTALAPLARFVGTPRVAKHRVFVWLVPDILADSATVVFARADDYFFGVLHSRAHEVWSLRLGTWLGVGNDPRYTPTTCFETFPLPWPPGREPWRDPRLHAVADAARELAGRTLERVTLRLPKLLRDSPLPSLDPLVARTVVGARRRAKVLIVDWSGDLSLLIHFKLAGQFAVLHADGGRHVAGHPVPDPAGPYPPKVTHVTLEFAGGTVAYLSDVRQFGWLRLMPTGDVAAAIAVFRFGPEAAGAGPLDLTDLAARLGRRTIAIKLALLDQTILAGLGNIYAAPICARVASLRVKRAVGRGSLPIRCRQR